MTTNINALVADYVRDGFVFPITIMSEAEARDYRNQLEALEAEDSPEYPVKRCLRRYPNLVLPFVDEILRRPEITDVVAEILGPNLLVLDAPFFIKEANTSSFVSWHQDLHYWGLEGEQEVTAWVALSPATVKAGCMKFVAGSHAKQLEHTDTFEKENLLSRGQEIVVEVDESDAVDGVLKAGQMSLHHGRVIHGSNPNITNDRRIGIAVRYISTRMTQAPGGNMAATLVRGEDRFGHFRSCRQPSGVMMQADLTHWNEIANARNSVMMGTNSPNA